MTPEQQGAVIADMLMTATVRAEIWKSSRAETIRQLKLAVVELSDETSGKIDAFDQMQIDVYNVLILHLEYIGNTETSRTLPVKVNVTQDLRDYALVLRKVAHGCWDASCVLCDQENKS